MGDIVKRLRHRDLNCSPEAYHREVVGRAADEIDRLRLLLVASTRRIPHVLNQIDREFGDWPPESDSGRILEDAK